VNRKEDIALKGRVELCEVGIYLPQLEQEQSEPQLPVRRSC
jgi:hypothetical protein